MTARWLPGDMLCFDVESTGPDPETARIVTAYTAIVGPGGIRDARSWLVNPGCSIPAEATAVHGVTDEMAASGVDPDEAAGEIASTLQEAWCAGLPVVAMNATYDLTVISEECRRTENEELGGVGPVLDPLVIDRAMDPYRPGKRNLTALAQHYRVKQGAAHSADGDALTAARIVWAQAKLYWALEKKTLAEMQVFQAAEHRKWAIHYADYLRGKTGKEQSISTDWPIRRTRADTRAA